MVVRCGAGMCWYALVEDEKSGCDDFGMDWLTIRRGIV